MHSTSPFHTPLACTLPPPYLAATICRQASPQHGRKWPPPMWKGPTKKKSDKQNTWWKENKIIWALFTGFVPRLCWPLLILMQILWQSGWDQLVTFVNFWFVLPVRIIVLALFVLRILPSLIVLKADLEGPSSLRDLLLDNRSKLPIRNTNNARTINS